MFGFQLRQGNVGAKPAFNPTSLFRNGEQGVIYDPNDLSTLFQDAAGTTPVTAAGQPVGLMLDKSGRGNHISFGDGAARPMLRFNATTGCYYLEPDGADDFGVTLPIDFTGTDKVSVFTGVESLADTISVIVDLSASPAGTPNTFTLLRNQAAGARNYSFGSRGLAAFSYAHAPNGAYPTPSKNVISAFGNISGDSSVLRINGAQVASNSQDQGAGNYGNYPLYLFRRGGTSLPFNGHFYGLTIVGRLTTDAETRNVERLYAAKTGVQLL